MSGQPIIHRLPVSPAGEPRKYIKSVEKAKKKGGGGAEGEEEDDDGDATGGEEEPWPCRGAAGSERPSRSVGPARCRAPAAGSSDRHA